MSLTLSDLAKIGLGLALLVALTRIDFFRRENLKERNEVWRRYLDAISKADITFAERVRLRLAGSFYSIAELEEKIIELQKIEKGHF